MNTYNVVYNQLLFDSMSRISSEEITEQRSYTTVVLCALIAVMLVLKFKFRQYW